MEFDEKYPQGIQGTKLNGKHIITALEDRTSVAAGEVNEHGALGSSDEIFARILVPNEYWHNSNPGGQPSQAAPAPVVVYDGGPAKYYAPLLKRQELIASEAIKPDSPWTRYKNGGCAYYKRQDPLQRSLEEPAEGVKDEVAQGDEQFEKFYAWLMRKEELIAAGAIKPDSPWAALPDEHFEKFYAPLLRSKEMIEPLRTAGIYSAASPWVKCGEGAFAHKETLELRTEPPAEGVSADKSADSSVGTDLFKPLLPCTLPHWQARATATLRATSTWCAQCRDASTRPRRSSRRRSRH